MQSILIVFIVLVLMNISCDEQTKLINQAKNQGHPKSDTSQNTSSQHLHNIKIVKLDPFIIPDKQDINTNVTNSEESKNISMIPTPRPDRKKWRIAYLVGGNYLNMVH